ncbi:MAG: hypothetical protein M1825_000631 [Sarcosagium campestre]|nr:MAG: hypothetical protein M1825_000631 [Sarcosagium campestre]
MDAQDTDRHSNDDEYATPQLLPSTIDSSLAKLDDATSFSDEIKSKSHSARNLANHALEFFANASNETLTACFIGLGAATYLLLGRLGLILIGLVGGILVHAAWEETGGAQSGHESRADEARRRKKLGLEIANRVLDWREQKHDEDLASADPSPGHQRSSSSTRDLSNLTPETRAALESLTDAVIRDYVK